MRNTVSIIMILITIIFIGCIEIVDKKDLNAKSNKKKAMNRDLKKELSEQIESCKYFLIMSSEDIDRTQFTKDLKEFSSDFEKFPKIEKVFLIDFSETYIKYSTSLSQDLLNSFSNYLDSGVFEFKISQNTQRELNLLQTYLSDDVINQMIEMNNKLNKYYSENLPRGRKNIRTDEIETLINSLKEGINKQNNEYRNIYYQIFNKEYQP